MNQRSKKPIVLLGLLCVIGAIVLYGLFTPQPLIKLIRFTVFNSFELEGDAVGDVARDIVYKTASGKSLMVDLYLPLEKNYESAPVVIFSHGGGWVMGGRSTMFTGPDNEQLILRLRTNGFAIANFDYRLIDETTTLSDPVADHKDLVRWLRANAGDYGLDPENIGYWGQSAGGHLVLMAGLTDDREFSGDEGLSDTSASVDYIVNNYGVTDLTAQFSALIAGEQAPGFLEKGQTENMFAASFEEDRDAFARSLPALSPVSYVDGNDPPVLTLHGDSDTLVSPNQSRLLQQAQQQRGAAHEVHFIANADHVFNGATPEQVSEIVELTAEFIIANTHAPQSARR